MKEKSVGCLVYETLYVLTLTASSKRSKVRPRNGKKSVDVTSGLIHGPPKSGITNTISKTLA